eukprot:901702-Pyramimonas_sp.AAC.1
MRAAAGVGSGSSSAQKWVVSPVLKKEVQETAGARTPWGVDYERDVDSKRGVDYTRGVDSIKRGGAQDNDGVSPLYNAARNGHFETVDSLVRAGAFVDLCDNFGSSPLHISAAYGHVDIVETLLNGGANVHHRDMQ